MSRWHNHYLDGHAHLVTATVRDWRPLLTTEAVHVLYHHWSAVRAALGVSVLAVDQYQTSAGVARSEPAPPIAATGWAAGRW